MLTKNVRLELFTNKSSLYATNAPQVVLRQGENKAINLQAILVDQSVFSVTGATLKATLPGGAYAEVEATFNHTSNTVSAILPDAFSRYKGKDGLMYFELVSNDEVITTQDIHLTVLGAADVRTDTTSEPYIGRIEQLLAEVKQQAENTSNKSLNELTERLDDIQQQLNNPKVQELEQKLEQALKRIQELEQAKPKDASTSENTKPFSYKDTQTQIWGASWLTSMFGMPLTTLDDMKAMVEQLSQSLFTMPRADDAQLVAAQNQAKINAILTGLKATVLKDESDQETFFNAYEPVERDYIVPQFSSEQLDAINKAKQEAQIQEAIWRDMQDRASEKKADVPYPGYKPYAEDEKVPMKDDDYLKVPDEPEEKVAEKYEDIKGKDSRVVEEVKAVTESYNYSV